MSENPYFTNEEAAQRGEEARRMLESPVLRDAIADAQRRFVAEWLEAHNRDVRDACWSKIHALDAVKDGLRRIVADGDVATALIERANQPKPE